VYVLYRHENVLVIGYKIFYKSVVQLCFKVINYACVYFTKAMSKKCRNAAALYNSGRQQLSVVVRHGANV
jgi:hypothetical protein